MLVRLLTLLFFISSCSTFRQTESPLNYNVEELFKAVKITGEGRGRLGIEKHKYLFGFESILKENSDWLLAVSIPLHGEEVMIEPNLKEKKNHREEQSFETRIKSHLPPEIQNTFLTEFRSLLRFVLSEELGLKKECEKSSEDHFLCGLDDEIFIVSYDNKSFFIKKILKSGPVLELVTQNLTESIFTRTNIYLHSQNTSAKKDPILSLELFWK